MAAGCFLGIAVVLRGGLSNSEWSERTPLLLGLLAAFALGCVVAYTGVERITMARVARARLEVRNGEAGSEAVGLIAAGVGVALLVSHMPSRERLDRFVERAREHP